MFRNKTKVMSAQQLGSCDGWTLDTMSWSRDKNAVERQDAIRYIRYESKQSSPLCQVQADGSEQFCKAKFERTKTFLA